MLFATEGSVGCWLQTNCNPAAIRWDGHCFRYRISRIEWAGILLLVQVLASSGCSSRGIPTVTVKPIGANIAILPAESFSQSDPGFFIEGGEGFWTPDAESVRSAEKSIAAFLQRECDRTAPNSHVASQLQYVRKNLGTQHRQYVGIIQGGKRLLYLNALPPADAEDDVCAKWKTEYCQVYDGGADFWQVFFNVETGEFSGLQINSEA